MNYTIVKSNEENKLINSETGEYSGYFGKLQRGEADAAAYPTVMPLIGITNVTQLNSTATASGVYLLSPYSTQDSVQWKFSDLLDQFQIVSLEVWSHSLLLAIYFWTVLTALQRLYQLAKKVGRFEKFDSDPLYGQPVYYQVATHMLQTETCDYIRFKERFVSMLMSLFAFFFITLFTNMMTTSKVSTRSFSAFDTYDKILGNKSVQPIWISYLFDHYWYRDAQAGSQQRQLWEQSVRISEEAMANGKFKPSLITTAPESMFTLGERALKQEFVIFFTNMFHRVFLRAANLILPTVRIPSDFSNLRFKASKDMHIQASCYVLPVSVHSKETDGMYFLAGVLHEHALFSDPMTQTQIIESIASYSPSRPPKNGQYFERLQYFYKIPEDEAETVELVPKNFSHLFYLFLSSCTMALLVLLYEKWTNKKNKVKESP